MKLTKQDIINFCEDCDKGFGQTLLARKYNVSPCSASNMKSRYLKHGINNLLHKPNNNSYSKELKLSICKRILDGEPKKSLAVELGVNHGTIFSCLKSIKN